MKGKKDKKPSFTPVETEFSRRPRGSVPKRITWENAGSIERHRYERCGEEFAIVFLTRVAHAADPAAEVTWHCNDIEHCNERKRKKLEDEKRKYEP